MKHSRTHLLALAALAALAATALTPAASAQEAATAGAAASAPTAAQPPAPVQPTQPAAPAQPASAPDKSAPPPEGAAAANPASAAPETTAFDISVRAPHDVRELLEKHMELQRYRAVSDLDEIELGRLTTLAERNVRNLVGTLGYFSPKISITREGGAHERPVIVVAVDPGGQTHIGAVDVNFSGDISDSSDADAIAQRTRIQQDWRLGKGDPFTQDGWSSAKMQALRQLVARRYPAGKLAGSLADIDEPSRSANLHLHYDSGPLYRLGPLHVSGIKRYDPVLAPRLARLKEGAVYDQTELMQAQQRLAASGYFDSAYVFVDPKDDPQAAPVQVQLREAKLQKLILGVGMTTDNGPRMSIEHTHHRVPGVGWRAVTKLQLEKTAPSAQTEWTDIPDESGWRWGVLGRVERVNDNELVTQAQRLRFGRSQTTEQIDRNLYLQYDRASVWGNGVPGNSASDTGDGSAITANYAWTGRYFDGLPFPSKGYGLGFELGVGTTLGQDRQPFTRALGRWLGIYPLERGRIAVRAEGGAVLARNSATIPSTQLFRTGGDTTVRGYGYRTLGIALANGVTGPGRYQTVGSIEWQRPMLIKGKPSEFENTFFIDAGAVADKPQDLRPAVGVGTGLRVRSPIGPLQIDLAYGFKVQQVRLHISVGFVF